MKKSKYTEVINTTIEKTWEVLFSQYGDIHIHNPTMSTSKYLNGTTSC